jgi:hypothetical protein
MMRVLLKIVFCLTFFVWANYFAYETCDLNYMGYR